MAQKEKLATKPEMLAELAALDELVSRRPPPAARRTATQPR
jgi:hypothetical protein